MSKKFHSSSPAFTLIELLIVIVVIAILAVISIVMYNGIQNNAAETALKSDLRNAATKLGLVQADSGAFPDSATGLSKSQGVTFEYSSDGQTYCLSATSSRSGVGGWHISNAAGLAEGVCSGHSDGGGDSGDTYTFNYANRAALVGAGWSFTATLPGGGARDTEDAGDLSYGSGGLDITAKVNTLYGNPNNTTNMLFRALPSDWTAAELALDFVPLGNHDTAGMVIYVDDNNYVQFSKSFTAGSTPIVYLYREQDGTVYDETYPAYAASDIVLRIERSGDTYTAKVSSNSGSSWTTIQSVTQTLASPRFGIYVGASDHGTPHAVAKIKRVSFE